MLIMPASTFSRNFFLSASFQRAEVSFERPGLFNIVRYEKEGERRLFVGVVWLRFDSCRVFLQVRFIDEKRLCYQSQRALMCVWLAFC